MATQITLLGINLIGASLGLALSAREFPVTGFDPKLEVAQAAQKQGAVRQVKWNMAQAVADADLTLVCLPLAEQREALDAIAQDFKPGSVVVCVAPLLAPPLAWATEVLPADRQVLALHPLLSPARSAPAAASADLFKHGLWALAPAPTCAPEALQLLNGLANVAGATPYFVDPVEHDGLMGGASALPAMLALALMRAASTSPGWNEMRKVAGADFATATAALDNVDQTAAALHLNRDNALRYLDAAQAELAALREKLAGGDVAALAAWQEAAAESRATWLADCARGDWDAPEKPLSQAPSAADAMKRFLVGGLFDRKKK